MNTQNKSIETLFSVGEVQLRYVPKQHVYTQKSVTSSRDAFNILNGYYDSGELLYREIFVVLLLNRSNTVMNIIRISEGGISGTVADAKMIFSAALLSGASSLVISHNHPSGNLNPSKADEALTKKIKLAAEFLEISLLDHLILTSNGYYSFADEGQL